MKRTPQLEERSDVRNLQDITTKIVTDISAVAGSSLEQKSWLSKTYVVKAGNQGIAIDDAQSSPEPENLSDEAEAIEGWFEFSIVTSTKTTVMTTISQ